MPKRSRAAPRSAQLLLPLPGISAAGARRRGRKPSLGRRSVRHRAREAHSAAHPVHVVLRSRLRSLRTQFVFPTVRRALSQATRARGDFRVTQFSVQGDHLHLIVEASHKSALSRGMQGLAIRVARAVNRLIFRRGKLWADRFFSRELKSPRVVRNALAYVLDNFRKHRARGGAWIDPYSSAPYFNGFRGLRGRAPHELTACSELPLTPRGVSPPATEQDIPIVQARTWLANTGWRRAGLIAFRAT
ncbi:MAG TPA: transposase [Polyangiaceae bacterium]